MALSHTAAAAFVPAVRAATVYTTCTCTPTGSLPSTARKCALAQAPVRHVRSQQLWAAANDRNVHEVQRLVRRYDLQVKPGGSWGAWGAWGAWSALLPKGCCDDRHPWRPVTTVRLHGWLAAPAVDASLTRIVAKQLMSNMLTALATTASPATRCCAVAEHSKVRRMPKVRAAALPNMCSCVQPQARFILACGAGNGDCGLVEVMLDAGVVHPDEIVVEEVGRAGDTGGSVRR